MSYFHFHANGHNYDAQLITQQCSHIRVNGQRCKKRVAIGLPMCFIHDRIVQHVKMAKSNIPNAGIGIFAFNGTANNAVVFKARALIAPYYGEIIDDAELDRRYGDFTGPYALEIRHNVNEDGARKRGLGTLANHDGRFNRNNEPMANAGLAVRQGKGCIIALKPIRNGQEILVNYGNDYVFNEPGVTTSTNRKKCHNN